MSSQPSSHRQNLTNERRKLRNLHRNPQPRDKITCRGHTIRREVHDYSQTGCYRILNEHNQFVDTIEPSDFHNADDWVRYIDLVIQHDRERARDWYNTELAYDWTEVNSEGEQ